MAEFDYYLAQFVDIHGRPKAKLVPSAHSEAIFSSGVGFAGFAISGMGMQPNGPEFMAVGDRKNIRPMTWMPGGASVTCEGYVKGQPHAFDSRVIARRAMEKFRESTGLEFFSGLEPEFFLLRPTDSGDYVVATGPEVLDKPCYDLRLLSRVAPVLREIHEALAAAGIDVYQIDHEDGNGQFEMNFVYADGLTTADNLTFFKMASQAIAEKHGLLCSFMPKPFLDRSGSGLHMHISAGSHMGHNAFEDVADPRGNGLSEMAYHFLGGLIAHAPALTAFAAPSPNSYQRLTAQGSRSGATWAPVNIAWGDNNRTAFVRLPGGRLELRVPDSAANPYLLTAAVIYAGLDGVENKLDAGPSCDHNLYELSEFDHAQMNFSRLPNSLTCALDELMADEVLCSALGSNFTEYFCDLKQQEWAVAQKLTSDEIFNKYVDFY